MIKPLSLLVLLVLAAYVHSQVVGPPYIIIQGVLRDQAPAEMKDCEAVGTNNGKGRAGTANGTFGFVGTDFQLPSGYYQDNEKGLVGAECNNGNAWGTKTPCGRIGLDRTPVYAHPGRSPGKNVQSPTTFNRWFHDSEQTKNIVYSISLAKSQDGSGLYSYRNNSQFPLDGQGWGDFCADGGNPKKNHNYGYCWETHFRFGYQGGERFTFTGDDDVWVYINDILVIDLGSLHTSMTSSIFVDNIPGLKKGQSYRFDFFYCERHTTESNMQITTSLAAYCAYTDWCGVCEGNGQSCCTDEIVDKYCNDGDLCTIESCGVIVPPNTTNCNRERVQCDTSNICKPTSCNPKTGKCETTEANCDDKNLCTEDVCINPIGCRYTYKTCTDNNLCTSDKCDSETGKCVFDPIICDDGDACTTSTCNPATGCVHQRLTCPSDRCTSTTCNRYTGCANTTINCADNNACTIESCDPATGCKKEILNCDDGDACTSDKCDTEKGCVFTPVVCNDNSNCTIDSCSKTRGCDYKPVECATQKCKNVKCDINLGCVYTDKNCNDNNPCTDDSCDLNSDQCRNIQKVCDDKSQCTTDACVAGTCRFTPVVCTDTDMCTNNFCTNSTGCGTSVVDCNDNNACTTDSCSPATGCGYKDVSCDDQDACTVDSCDSKTGCKNEKLNCDDGNECTIDSCDKARGCQYAPRVCNDGSRCTTDSCNNKTGCVFSQITCNDNSRCTTDTCAPATGCVYTTITCNDNIACTIDSCSPSIGCTAVNKNCASGDDCIIGSCDATSGLCKNSTIPDCTKCTNRPSCALETTDKCQPKICDPNTGDCINGLRVNCDDRSNCTVDSCLDGKCSNTAVTCDDNNPCTIDSCDKVNGCIFTPIVCNDFSVCTNDSCVNGECVFTRNVCNDNLACTIDTCNATTGCVFTDVQCGDNNKCTNEVCNTSTGKCEYPAVVCNDDKACTVDTCNPATGCVFTDKVCNDNSLCTTDSCPPATGVCAFDPINCTATLSATKCDIVSCTATKGCSKVPMVCDDNNPCTADSCSEITGSCVFTPIAEFCLPCAGTPCTWSDSCNPKICDNTTNTCKESPVVCNDNTACTTDKCDNSGPEAKCIFTDISCPTLDFCKPVSCDRVAGCVTTDVVCDDNNLCTDDSCVSNESNFTCVFTPKACTGADLCNPTVCNLTTGSCDVHPIVCDDQNLCTDDSCDLTSGQCSFVLRECTKDTCNPEECERESGLCVPTPVVCNDGNPCTIDSVVCSANTSFVPECLFVTNATICDDGDPCTDDVCDSTVLPGENPCKNTTTICPRVSPCYIDLGCVPDVGCSKVERDCLSNATETLNKCTIYKCDPTAGCIYEPKICENRDINCFVNECNNATGNCEESKSQNFNSAKAKTGVICPLVYDSKVKTAALAGGIVAGIVLGAVAAAAIIGFGGKAGYDFLMAKNSPMGPVASNPLYTQAAGAGNNPLYGGSP